MSVLGTVLGDRSELPFHGGLGSGEPPKGGPSRLHPLLAITALRGLKRLGGAVTPLTLPRPVRSPACVTAPTPRAREY